MSRRTPALIALIALIALVALSACGNTPSPAGPTLTDPREILTKALTAMAEVKTMHLEAEVKGSLNLDLFGTGNPQALKLDGTSGDADVDIAGSKVQAHFVTTFAITGELIQIGDTTYTKTSMTGKKYAKSTSADVGIPLNTDPAQVVAQLKAFLERPEIAPIKGADQKCVGNVDCYTVEINLTADEIAGMAAGAPGGVSFGDGALAMKIGVERGSLRIGRIVLSVGGGAMGALDITIDFSKWDNPLNITEPPADQVE